jgi:hypothetical protein
MPFAIEQRGFDEQGQRLRLIAGGLDNLDPVLNVIASDLAQLWRDNIDAGPNDRWQAGPSYRAETFGGTTLRDRGLMQASIIGQQTSPSEISVGSPLTVGNGWNLLAIHEFGAEVVAKNKEWLTFRYPLASSTEPGWARKKEIIIPKRPTAPFDWDRGELMPEADQLVRLDIDNYIGGLCQ